MCFEQKRTTQLGITTYNILQHMAYYGMKYKICITYNSIHYIYMFYICYILYICYIYIYVTYLYTCIIYIYIICFFHQIKLVLTFELRPRLLATWTAGLLLGSLYVGPPKGPPFFGRCLRQKSPRQLGFSMIQYWLGFSIDSDIDWLIQQ